METGRGGPGHVGRAGHAGHPGHAGSAGPLGPLGPLGQPGPRRTPAPARDADAEADAAAIEELRDRVRQLWPNLPEPVREDLAECLTPLAAAAERRETDSRAVRETLQTVLLIVGTGALTTLSVASRRRLTALTGIALPERGGR